MVNKGSKAFSTTLKLSISLTSCNIVSNVFCNDAFSFSISGSILMFVLGGVTKLLKKTNKLKIHIWNING